MASKVTLGVGEAIVEFPEGKLSMQFLPWAPMQSIEKLAAGLAEVRHRYPEAWRVLEEKAGVKWQSKTANQVKALPGPLELHL